MRQRTQEEKRLGEAICQTIRDHGTFDCFFAETQQNLKGLHENILDALARSDGFITVMHRRGNVSYGPENHEPSDRASVWIEQEIAIAAYIQQTAKNDLLTAAYIEEGVGLEGLRTLLHLNPMPFTSNDEVIPDLKARLNSWKSSSANDNFGELKLEVFPAYESGIQVKRLTPILTYKGSRANEYSCTLEIPELLVNFNTAYNVLEVQRKPEYRRFQATEITKQRHPLLRDNPVKMLTQDVAIAHLTNEQKEQVLRQNVIVSADIGERAYSLTKSCAEIFAEGRPESREEVTEQRVQQRPIYQGPDGWREQRRHFNTVWT